MAFSDWELETEDTIYFWGGILSNWASYQTKSRLHQEQAGTVDFGCSEQYMMAQKALLFHDYGAFYDVMNTTSPAEQKSIGRRVEGYTDAIWAPQARRLSYIGIYDKFQQNWKIGDKLLSTGDKLLVEASPTDRRWGIGYNYLQAEYNRDKWGMNWLGQCLMQARHDLRYGYDSRWIDVDWERWYSNGQSVMDYFTK